MKKLLLAAIVLSLSVPVANAQTTTTVTTSPAIRGSQEIVMGPFGTDAQVVLPQLSVAQGGHLGIHLLNPSPNALTFSIPDLNTSVIVPPNSERVVYLDSAQIASLTPGEPIAYYIVDSNGTQLASSTITQDQTIVSQLFQQTTTLTTASDTVDPEPVYNTTQSQSTVRGFW